MCQATAAEGVGHRIRTLAVQQSRLLRNAGSMVGATVVTSALGVAFWWVAAHNFSESAVGVASAAVGAMTLLGFLATLGLGTLLMGELPRLDNGHHALINAALAVTLLAGGALGLVFAAVVPHISSNFSALDANPLSLIAFAAGVGLTALAFVLDQALIGLLHGGLQLRRNAAFALAKLLALIPVGVLVTTAGPAWIYAVWAFGIAASLFVLPQFFRHPDARRLRPDLSLLSGRGPSAASHHAFNVALQIPGLLMPVLVVGLVSPAANAAFYIAWMISGLLVMVPVSLGTVLYPIGSEDQDKLQQGLRLALAISLGIGLIANLMLMPLASPLLELFGRGYAENGATSLHILALGVFPLTFKTLYVSVRRVQRRLATALPVVWGGTLLELAGATLGEIVLGGLTGISWGWLLAVVIEGLVMGGEVIGVSRGGGSTRPSQQDDAQRA